MITWSSSTLCKQFKGISLVLELLLSNISECLTLFHVISTNCAGDFARIRTGNSMSSAVLIVRPGQYKLSGILQNGPRAAGPSFTASPIFERIFFTRICHDKFIPSVDQFWFSLSRFPDFEIPSVEAWKIRIIGMLGKTIYSRFYTFKSTNIYHEQPII